MRALILAGWLVASLLIVPIAATAYGAGLFKAGWIPETGRNRIILWAVTANEVRKAPYLGVGVGSTKELDEQAAPKAQKPADHTYPLRTGRHAHNVFMQTWYELGAAGALILSAIGVCAWLVLGRLEPNLQPYAFASFVCAAVIGAFSWGMWQTWFMAAYAIWALALALAIEWARRGDDEPA
jgi:O-antigen ligase